MTARILKYFALAVCLLLTGANYISAGQIEAEALLKDAGGESIGAVLFKQEPGGPVEITVDIHSFLPGERAIHIHEYPCEAPDFDKAGGHFNPEGKKHGFLNKEGPHAGDLPNILVDEEGNCRAVFISSRITLEEGKKNSILRAPGTSIVIHKMPDDYFTDPAGRGGERIACGTIRKISPAAGQTGCASSRVPAALRRIASLILPGRGRE